MCVKKTTRYTERDHNQRVVFLQNLRTAIQKYGKENIVYFDESGFEENVVRLHGWAKRGKRIYGDISGGRRQRTNLIMAQRCKEWLAPMVFEFSCNANVVYEWLEKMLLPELSEPSVIVMDNASFHKKDVIHELLEQHGHTLLPLPPYSPDFNPIEESFAVLKKRRLSTQPPQKVEQLLL
ncbi:MAG: IS630 family transposase [Magnetococcales bacterium]|nr:IS630 family transposase [Magnetococcales bacterium]